MGKPDQIADQKSTPGLLLYLHLPPGPQHLQKQAIVRKHNPKLTEFIEYLLHSEYPIEKEQEIERIKAIMQELPPQCLKVFMLSTIEEEKEKKEEEFDKLFNYNRQSIQNLLITTFNEKWFCNRTT